jgi:hypothetical protein
MKAQRLEVLAAQRKPYPFFKDVGLQSRGIQCDLPVSFRVL